MWTKEEIKENLKTNDLWVIKGVLAIYKYQTEEEQAVGCTKINNGVGFNGCDDIIMSSFAEQIKEWEKFKKYSSPLSKKQLTIARKKIIKYSGQLSKIANGEL